MSWISFLGSAYAAAFSQCIQPYPIAVELFAKTLSAASDANA